MGNFFVDRTTFPYSSRPCALMHINKYKPITYIYVSNYMFEYEIQLQYAIRDKIQSETKFSLRIFFLTIFFVGKNFYWKKILSEKKILGFCLKLNFV